MAALDGTPVAVSALRAPWLRQAWEPLRALRARAAHAILLHGAAGIGKKALALEFAAALLCEQPQDDGTACGVCSGCRLRSAGNHPDLRVVVPDSLARLRPAPAGEGADGDEAAATPSDGPDEAGGERKEKRASRDILIEQVRALLDFANVATHRGGLRVVVLAPAESLNGPAANALLKLLEEPAPGTVFVLTSDALDRVLPTIRSRCVLLRVPAPTWDEAQAWLTHQGVPQAAEALAASGGAPWPALDAGEEVEAAAELRQMLVRLLAQGPSLAADEVAARIPRTLDTGVALRVLARWGWDLAAAASAGVVRYHRAQASTIARLGATVSPAAVMRWTDDLAREQRSADHPLNARLVLEAAMFGYIGLWRSSNARS